MGDDVVSDPSPSWMVLDCSGVELLAGVQPRIVPSPMDKIHFNARFFLFIVYVLL